MFRKALGAWTCHGVHTEDAATTTTGPIVATTQILDLGDSVAAAHHT